MKTNFNLLFYMKKPKNYVSGNAPIYLRITVEGKRSEVFTGRECDPKRWNAAAGRANGIKEEVKSFNAYLDNLQSRVYDAHRELMEERSEITAEAIRDKFAGKKQTQRFLLEVLKEHNSKLEALIGNGFAANTLKGYGTTVKHLTAFLKQKYNTSDVDVRRINHEFVTNYEFYIRSSLGCSAVSAAKYIKHFRKIINLCLANSWITANPLAHYKSTAKAKEREFLTKAELDSLAKKNFSISRLEQVRDIFLFCCYTGLSYADVKKLRRSEISTGMDGGQWIFTNREKTDTSTRVPLLPVASMVLDRYSNHPQCDNAGLLLPVLSNQKMNAYLKEIADLCGVNKLLTFHIARHTFATTVTLSNGVPIETVSKMLGHTNLKTTQHYAKILDNKVSDDMMQLRQKLALQV